MANLVAQNIGTNYKGILNLDPTTINTPLDTTLRLVTDGMGNSSIFQLSTEQVGLSRTVALSAGSTNPRLFNEVYTINNSGAQTGTLTGIFLNATETALNGITHNLIDLQVGGVSKFKVSNAGALTAVSNITTIATIQAGNLNAVSNIYIGNFQSSLKSNGSGIIQLQNTPETGFDRLQLGGTTSSFPAIKRNGTAIDFRLADDSAYCSLNLLSINAVGNSTLQGSLAVGTGSSLASAILTVDSTTRGFLPPRMTTTQKNAIATPATGLVVFDTTLAKLAVYTGAGWETVTSI